MSVLCFVGLHKYSTIKKEKDQNGIIKETIACQVCPKQYISYYNPNAVHRCPICEEKESDCNCPAC